MKKIILAAVLFIATSATIQAQLVQFGVKAGVNFASQPGDASLQGVAFDKEGITSYHVGVVAEVKLLEKFSIQPELLYSTQGATYKFKDAQQDFKNKLAYLSVPVMAKIYMTKSLSLEVGPQASFLVSQKDDVRFNDANTFDFALNAGLGLKITNSIFVQGRYSLGLTDVSSSADVRNSVVQLSAGFLF
ncbi:MULTISPECIES: porin family protein [Flavobacterium]|jgi:hypothetical protein|uniref:porin family protein n=1 Tax=Flavobacterium TaxID=237 RepID=UPI00222334F6|nr:MULTISPECIES: porin family protein [Flavobacterium]GIQ58406.1 hypothetical protein Flavo103_15420 [Flavobacterium collinsii]